MNVFTRVCYAVICQCDGKDAYVRDVSGYEDEIQAECERLNREKDGTKYSYRVARVRLTEAEGE